MSSLCEDISTWKFVKFSLTNNMYLQEFLDDVSCIFGIISYFPTGKTGELCIEPVALSQVTVRLVILFENYGFLFAQIHMLCSTKL